MDCYFKLREKSLISSFCNMLLQFTFFFFFFLMHPAETANKSNVVTASTAIQLLDDRKSPVVAGKIFVVHLFCSFLKSVSEFLTISFGLAGI